ncbi:MAG: iron-sulfur cluster assembly protein [Anaerolineales bacterium]
MKKEKQDLKKAIIQRLQKVIDPETQTDVIRMRLVEDLTVEEEGRVHYTFRPSSPICPIAVSLVKEIKTAVAEVPGVTSQQITVTGYMAEKELTALINQEV